MFRIPISTPKNLARLSRRSGRGGFTLVEMVGALIIMAILVLVALPRFTDRDAFDARVFHDQTLAMLRHAQKIAIAQNRNVHVRLDGVSFAFCFNPFAGATCSSRVRAPAGANSGNDNTLTSCGGAANATWFCEGIPSGISSATASNFYFNALGVPFHPVDTPPVSTFTAQLDIPLTSGGVTRHIFVEPETGYVHP